MEQKAIKIRVEDARNGKVSEFETNCFALVTADRESKREVSTNRSLGMAGASTSDLVALIMRTEEVVGEIKDILNGEEVTE